MLCAPYVPERQPSILGTRQIREPHHFSLLLISISSNLGSPIRQHVYVCSLKFDEFADFWSPVFFEGIDILKVLMKNWVCRLVITTSKVNLLTFLE